MNAAYLTICLNGISDQKDIKIHLYGLPEYFLPRISTTSIAPGQPILVVASNAYSIPIALYTITSFGKPFQIYGQNDALMDDLVFCNLTQPILPILRMAQSMYMSVYAAISLKDLIRYESELLSWERLTMESILNLQDTKKIRQILIDHWNKIKIPEKNKTLGLIALNEHKFKTNTTGIALDLNGYPVSFVI